MGRRARCVAPHQRVLANTEISTVHVLVTVLVHVVVAILTIIRITIAITIVSVTNTTTISPSESKTNALPIGLQGQVLKMNA